MLSDNAKAAIGLAVATFFAVGVVMVGISVFDSMSNSTPTRQPTSGELYATEIPINEVADYPEDAIEVISMPGEPTRYYVLRDWQPDPQEDPNLVALQPPHEEGER